MNKEVHMSAEDFFNKVNKAAEASPDVASSMNAIFEFDITGDGGGTYVLDFSDGKTSDFLSKEHSEDAQVTVHVAYTDWESILGGKLDATAAFMTGKIKVDGDLSLAMKLPKILKLAQ